MSDFFTWQEATVVFEKAEHVSLRVFVNGENITSRLDVNEIYRVLWEMSKLFEQQQSEVKYWTKWRMNVTFPPHVTKIMFVRVPV